MKKWKLILTLLTSTTGLYTTILDARPTVARRSAKRYRKPIKKEFEQVVTQVITQNSLDSFKNTNASIDTLSEELDIEANENKQESTHLVAPIRPETATDDPEDMIEVNLENTDFPNLITWVSETFKVQFLTDDAFKPLPAGGKAISGNKVTFRTNTPLTKKQTWDLFVTFLDLFGLNIVEAPVQNFYKIKTSDTTSARTVNKSPLPSYINIHWSDLPDNDTKIRFIYFIRNSTLATIKDIVDAFRSATASLSTVQYLNAFILTDKSSNIRAIMKIVEELDAASMPEAMSVLKLKNADAQEVVQLYSNLTKLEDSRGLAARLIGTKKEDSAMYFPENTRLIAEPRTNTLIILGTQEGIKKIEDFIINHIDTELKIPYSPLYVYDLQYTKAEDIASILTNVTRFAASTDASKYGGVRDGDKYLQPMTFKAEPSGNRLLIRAEKEDYLKICEIIKKLDVKQPQIAIEVLIVNVSASDNKEIGVQFRKKTAGTVDFQTSGFPLGGNAKSRPITNTTSGNLIGNLVELAVGQSPGSTLISLAESVNGVWGMFKMLQTQAKTNLISNPFLVTTNKYTAEASIGEQRYVKTGQVAGNQSTDTFDYINAYLTVKITPQINSIGIINLDIKIDINTFSNSDDPQNADRDTKTIKTNANVGNKEVLALGGLLKTNKGDTSGRVPLLGDIPGLGWLFRNKAKTNRKDNLIVFISPRIIEPRLEGGLNRYTMDKTSIVKKDINLMTASADKRDPLHRWFFKDTAAETTEYVDSFLSQETHAVRKDIKKSIYCAPHTESEPSSNKKEKIDTKQKNSKKHSLTSYMPEKESEDAI